MATNDSDGTAPDWRHALIVAYIVGSLAAVAAMAPMPQDPSYHLFADRRSWLGVPNLLNVASNALFVIVGLLGIRATCRSRPAGSFHAWLGVFVGITLTGPGSAWYHWNPCDSSLLWDRLPITIGFMALFAALAGEFVCARCARWLLLPALLAGVGSIVYWRATGDLRFYAWVQFMPLGLIVILLALFGSRYTRTGLLWVALAFYAGAKAAEHLDAGLFETLGGTFSGHTLKHLLAAAGCHALVVMLNSRRPG